MATPSTFCVIYRTGGTCNFEWHRTLGCSYEQAQVVAHDIKTMGYPAYVENLNLSLSVGLPETYGVGGAPASNYQVIDPEDYIEYEDRQRFMARMADEPEAE
jgi:hypothetical protein